MSLSPTLVALGSAVRDLQEPWWIIGSAAVALHGVDTPVADIDVLLSENDASALLPTLGLTVQAGRPDELFRSAIFARWTAAAVPIEFMAGFCLREDSAWIEVRPRTRKPVLNGRLYVPERDELIAMLLRFRRPKDLARAALLQANS